MYVVFEEPMMVFVALLNQISMYFPNRDELLLRRVLALPHPSRIGDALRIFAWMPVEEPAMKAR